MRVMRGAVCPSPLTHPPPRAPQRDAYERAGVASANAVIVGSLQVRRGGVGRRGGGRACPASSPAWPPPLGRPLAHSARPRLDILGTLNFAPPSLLLTAPSVPPSRPSCRSQAEDFKSADARMLTSLLMVQDILNSSGGSGSARRPPHVVACIQVCVCVWWVGGGGSSPWVHGWTRVGRWGRGRQRRGICSPPCNQVLHVHRPCGNAPHLPCSSHTP